MPNYARRPISIVKGRKSSLWSSDGKKYIDFVSGIAAVNLGHSFPPITKAVQKQVGRLVHVSNHFHIEAQAEYASMLAPLIGKGKLFFCNSGTEANEAAIKLARRHTILNGDKHKTEIIAFEGSFHGRTLGSLSMTGQKKLKENFGPMVNGFKHLPYGDISVLEKEISAKTCAVVLEPIQGEFGVIVPKAGFLTAVAKLCKKTGTLLIVDEVQTGFGRTGKMFGYEHSKAKPDIVTMAKGIANGFPMGAIFAKNGLAESFTVGSHGSTMGGNPLVCTAAKTALEEYTSAEFLDGVISNSRYIMLRLAGLKKDLKTRIKEIRGLGMMIGIELNEPAKPVIDACAEKGLLVAGAGENVIRILPPLNISKVEIEKGMTMLSKALLGK